MRRRKKGQIEGQIFIYLVAIVLVSMILIYGYKAVRGLNKDIGEVSIIKFQTNLQNVMDRVAMDYGSIKVYNENDPMNVPAGYRLVCFADTSDNAKRQLAASAASSFPLIQDSLGTGAYGASENVFLVDDDMKQSVHIDKMGVQDYFFCTAIVQGKIYLRIEGFGDGAVVSRVR
ncbi:hypothetical protein JW968_05400 [Candidatus Woesearchaeota archaeon]|nr:hypothetical protein [Candidatus Woesearchaeota archaeon]